MLLPHRRSYRKNEVIEENKALLKEKYTTAKALGKQVSSDAAYAISGFLHSTYIQRYSMYKDVLYTKIFIKKMKPNGRLLSTCIISSSQVRTDCKAY